MMKRVLLIIASIIFFHPAYSQWLKNDLEADTSYVKIMSFIKSNNKFPTTSQSLFDKDGEELFLMDSLYDNSNILFPANLLLETMKLEFHIPSNYSGEIKSGDIYAFLLVDDVGFCEDIAITQGLDTALDEFVVFYFKNMPKVKFQRIENYKNNPPKSKIAIKRKVLPLVIHFISNDE